MKYINKEKIKIENLIEVFYLNNDKFNTEINIDNIPIEKIKELILPVENDPELYNPYKIDKNISIKLNELLIEKINFEFDKYEYYFQRRDISPLPHPR